MNLLILGIFIMQDSKRVKLLYYGSLIGYFKALWLGMIHVIRGFLENCNTISTSKSKMLNLDYEILFKLADSLTTSINNNGINNITELVNNLPETNEKKICKAMLNAIKEHYGRVFHLYSKPGVYYYLIQGSHMATHSSEKVKVSIVKKQRINGAEYKLDDETLISMEEALEWSFTNKWSPSNTGKLINPF